jgi:hypothetical protein
VEKREKQEQKTGYKAILYFESKLPYVRHLFLLGQINDSC